MGRKCEVVLRLPRGESVIESCCVQKSGCGTAPWAYTILTWWQILLILANKELADCGARIGRGMLYAATSSVPWANLHARTFEHDVLECGQCGGRLRVRAVIVDPDVATKILASISRLATVADQVGSVARGPPSEQMAIAW